MSKVGKRASKRGRGASNSRSSTRASSSGGGGPSGGAGVEEAPGMLGEDGVNYLLAKGPEVGA